MTASQWLFFGLGSYYSAEPLKKLWNKKQLTFSSTALPLVFYAAACFQYYSKKKVLQRNSN